MPLDFLQVFTHLNQSDDYNDLIKELDASLLELTSNSYFPLVMSYSVETQAYRESLFV